jgi:hypothetical protein
MNDLVIKKKAAFGEEETFQPGKAIAVKRELTKADLSPELEKEFGPYINILKAQSKDVNGNFILIKKDKDQVYIAFMGKDGDAVKYPKPFPLKMFYRPNLSSGNTMGLSKDEAEKIGNETDWSKIDKSKYPKALEGIIKKLKLRDKGKEGKGKGAQVPLNSSDYSFLMQTYFNKEKDPSAMLKKIVDFAKKAGRTPQFQQTFLEGMINSYDKNPKNLTNNKALQAAIFALKLKYGKELTENDIGQLLIMSRPLANQKLIAEIIPQKYEEAKKMLDATDPKNILNKQLYVAIKNEEKSRQAAEAADQKTQQTEQENAEGQKILEENDNKILVDQGFKRGLEDQEELADKFDELLRIQKNVLKLDPSYQFSDKFLEAIKSFHGDSQNEAKIISRSSGMVEKDVLDILSNPQNLFTTKDKTPQEIDALNKIKQNIFKAYSEVLRQDKTFKFSDNFKKIIRQIFKESHEQDTQNQKSIQAEEKEGDAIIKESNGAIKEDILKRIYTDDPQAIVSDLTQSGQLVNFIGQLANVITKLKLQMTPKLSKFLADANAANAASTAKPTTSTTTSPNQVALQQNP